MSRLSRPATVLALVLSLVGCRGAGRALGLVPSPGEQFATARLHEVDGRTEEARAIYRELFDRDEDDPDVCHRLGVVEAKLGNHAQADEFFRRALALDSDGVEIHVDHGEALAARGDHREAEKAFRRALSLDATHERALNGHGLALARRGKTDAALAQLSKVNDSATTHTMLAEVHAERGEQRRAVDAYTRAVDPDSDSGLNLHFPDLEVARRQARVNAFEPKNAEVTNAVNHGIRSRHPLNQEAASPIAPVEPVEEFVLVSKENPDPAVEEFEWSAEKPSKIDAPAKEEENPFAKLDLDDDEPSIEDEPTSATLTIDLDPATRTETEAEPKREQELEWDVGEAMPATDTAPKVSLIPDTDVDAREAVVEPAVEFTARIPAASRASVAIAELRPEEFELPDVDESVAVAPASELEVVTVPESDENWSPTPGLPAPLDVEGLEIRPIVVVGMDPRPGPGGVAIESRRRSSQVLGAVRWQEVRISFAHPATRATADNRLQRALLALARGDTFDDVVAEYSDGPNAAAGGHVGWTDLDDVPAELRGPLARMHVGVTSRPIRGETSHRIIRVVERRSH